MRARVNGFVVVVSLAASLGGAVAARAAGTDDEKQARSLYERAEKSFDLGKFSDALADYQAAYEAKALPGFLFNIAQCYRNLGNFERARFFFRRYLTLEPHAPNHRRVEGLIAEMTKQLDAQAAAGSPPPATEPAPADAKSAEAPPAATPAAERPPPPTVPGQTSATAPAAADVVTATAGPAVEESPPVWKRWWFWTGVGAVVAGGVVAAFFLTRPQTRTPGSLDHIDGR